uniref:(northern house mosquito) hypothetical protein n=1 Tax=Culex pipiens TaxID=7175 RepID=A0A8D8AJI0_CULPI
MKPGLLQRRIGRALHEHYHGHRPIGLLLVVGGLQNLATLHGLLWLRALGLAWLGLMTLIIGGLQNRTPHRPGLLLVFVGRGCIGGLQNLATLHGLLWLRALGRLHVSVVRFENLMTLVISGLQNRTPNSSGLVDDGLGRWIALLRR